mgnify:CR=1 FL=1
MKIIITLLALFIIMPTYAADPKVNFAEKFLQDGAKVKAFVFFRGRTIIFKENGEILLLRLAQALEEYGVVESMPKLEGKRMIMLIAPKKK